MLPGSLLAVPPHPSALTDTAVWTQIQPDTLHWHQSHSSAQVGSYLLVSGGHDGVEYTPELLLFNLGESFFPLPWSSVLPHVEYPHFLDSVIAI